MDVSTNDEPRTLWIDTGALYGCSKSSYLEEADDLRHDRRYHELGTLNNESA